MHRDKFFNFIEDLNRNGIEYYFLRGFVNLPEKPDTDIDLVYNHEQELEYHSLAKKHLRLLPKSARHNFGFAEYVNMLYTAYTTPGTPDKSIPNGSFRVDSYNCLYMKSPLTKFKKYWVLPYEFNNYVMERKIEVKVENEPPYYIPSVECEMLLLILRDILDLKGAWKQKHINRIVHLKSNYDKNELLKCVKMALPSPQKVVDCVECNAFQEIFNIVMGG